MSIAFQKAIKRDAKLRLALCGPAGSGKTYSLLSIASELGGPIAYVDTEHGSASKYADLFTFDVIEPADFDPRKLIESIKAAVEAGYRVICIDSLSHYWMGKGGELEMVDGAAKRTQGNSFAAWKTVTPVHNELVDTIIGAKIHVLVSMRTKTEWLVEKDERTGKSAPRKIGLAPVMRDGIEFEFDVCGDLDQENTLTITKSRCPALTNKVFPRPGQDMAQTLKAWLTGAPDEPKVAQPQATPAATPGVNGAPKQPFRATDDDIPTNMGGSWEDPETGGSGDRKVAEMKQRIVQQPATVGTPASASKPWTTFKGMIEAFKAQHERLGDTAYYSVLSAHGVKHANEFKSSQAALDCYAALRAYRLDDKSEFVAVPKAKKEEAAA